MVTLRNHIQLIGRVGSELSLSRTKSDKPYIKFSLATNENYINQKGEKVETTQWHRLVAWGQMAERIVQFAQKGTELLVSGKLLYNSYEDKEGVKRTIAEVRVDGFRPLQSWANLK